MSSQQETQLIKLLNDAKKMMNETKFETCTQWIDREIVRTKKQKEQIERLQNHPSITARLFNESRDVCDQIHLYIERLRDFRSNMSRYGRQITVETTDDLKRTGMLNNASIEMEWKSPF
ncbi:hypothetical protein DERF_012747 [Dermatophagoides farinae]|uniref:Uncharacterized protein n=1 Tax=Dermatophagoides farinae TaxID=6954 RepID=A0A922HSP1_DERFA|nr:uncharacterized protein LOC124497224 [Dermatophagoides farinae]KAH9501938.1 hypothetical protein DERF_012747 [Dermatophagoides farinae]